MTLMFGYIGDSLGGIVLREGGGQWGQTSDITGGDKQDGEKCQKHEDGSWQMYAICWWWIHLKARSCQEEECVQPNLCWRHWLKSKSIDDSSEHFPVPS